MKRLWIIVVSHQFFPKVTEIYSGKLPDKYDQRTSEGKMTVMGLHAFEVARSFKDLYRIAKGYRDLEWHGASSVITQINNIFKDEEVDNKYWVD